MTKDESDISEYIAINKKFWDHIVKPAYRCFLCSQNCENNDKIYFDTVEDMEKHIMRHHTGDEVMEFIYRYDNVQTHTSRLRLFSEKIDKKDVEKND